MKIFKKKTPPLSGGKENSFNLWDKTGLA